MSRELRSEGGLGLKKEASAASISAVSLYLMALWLGILLLLFIHSLPVKKKYKRRRITKDDKKIDREKKRKYILNKLQRRERKTRNSSTNNHCLRV